MARRYELITELYRQSIREITSRPEIWTSFLRSACRNYRLPFDELVPVSYTHLPGRYLIHYAGGKAKSKGTNQNPKGTDQSVFCAGDARAENRRYHY